MRPIFMPPYVKHIADDAGTTEEQRIEIVRNQYNKLVKESPEVSVVVPAYNEQRFILQTLQSLTANRTNKSVEIIVVNNNSTDRTEQLVRATGIPCINETQQGVTAARNAGLKLARGKFILNADADTIYPACWIDDMVQPLMANKNIALTYGRYAFIPVGATKRLTYYFYEHITECIHYLKTRFAEEAVNVVGFNSAFRKEQGLLVDGFNHPPTANEDGYLALKLRNQGFGKLHNVVNTRTIVWTTDRRIQIDGGFLKGTIKRIKKLF